MPEYPDRALTGDRVAALQQRYEDRLDAYIVVPQGVYEEMYARVCDAAVQIMWADQYQTNPGDPALHTSGPARAFANILMAAVGIAPEDAPEEAND